MQAGRALEGGNAADKAGGIGVSISLGSTRSQSQQNSQADTAHGSSVRAGGDITIQAIGAGQNSDLSVRGSEISAAGHTLLRAEDQLNLVAAQNSTQESSRSRNSSGSIGVGINLGSNGVSAGVTLSASAGKGQGAGDATSYSNSLISGNRVTLESGGDTTIRGAVVQGERVRVEAGGNLGIESLQDQSQYREKSKQVGGSVTFGPSPGGSLSAGQTKINSDFLSVGEQSAIRAGDGGFDVQVAGKTQLTGAQITSTQAAIDQDNNRYEAKQGTTTTDLQNSARYEAKSVSVGLAVGTPKPGASLSTGLSGVGLGSDTGSAGSTSTAGISGMAGNTAARTADAGSGLKPIFDKDKARQEVNAQVAITSEFGQQASKAAGDYAKQQYDQAKEAGDKQGMAAWEEGGQNRVALHVLVGGLTGGVQGAVGAGAASAAAPKLEELQAGLKTALKEAGLGDSAANLISGLAGGATAATIGAAASGGNTAGAVTAFNADINNRQLHATEKQRIQQLAANKARTTCRGNGDCEKQVSLYWTDMLERAAKNRIETQDAIKNQAYYNQIIAASGKPGSEASLGMGERFFNDLGEAHLLLSANAGAPILDARGRPVLGTDGKPQTYFSATQAQRDNPYGNIFPGGSPSDQVSVIAGKEQRDQARLERMNVLSGQAVLDTTIEEILFGLRLPIRGGEQAVQGVARAWESSKVLAAGEILMSKGGNISAQQLTRVGNPAGLTSNELNMLKQIDSMNSFQAGTVREVVADSYFQRNEFMAMDGKCGAGNCFDGVYLKGDQVIVNEVKPLNADGSIRLNSGDSNTYLPTQGSLDWVTNRAQLLAKSADPSKAQTGAAILKAINEGKLTVVISGVNRNGMVIVKVKP